MYQRDQSHLSMISAIPETTGQKEFSLPSGQHLNKVLLGRARLFAFP